MTERISEARLREIEQRIAQEKAEAETHQHGPVYSRECLVECGWREDAFEMAAEVRRLRALIPSA